MFVSVKERVPIIGLQKSLGAKNYFILLQFLFESSFLSVFGGLFGIFLVFLLSLIDLGTFDLIISLKNVIIGKGVKNIGYGAFYTRSLETVTFLGDAPDVGEKPFDGATTIYRKPDAKGWGDTWGGRPVKLISEKP